MPSRMVLGIKPVPASLIKLHQRLGPNLALCELQTVASKIKALLVKSDRHGESNRLPLNPQGPGAARRLGLQAGIAARGMMV